MRLRAFIAAALLAALPFPLLTPSSAQVLPPGQTGVMLSENNRMLEDMMALMRDMASIMRNMNVTPTPEQKNTLELMAKKLDFMLMEHRNFMMGQGMTPPPPPSSSPFSPSPMPPR